MAGSTPEASLTGPGVSPQKGSLPRPTVGIIGGNGRPGRPHYRPRPSGAGEAAAGAGVQADHGGSGARGLAPHRGGGPRGLVVARRVGGGLLRGAPCTPTRSARRRLVRPLGQRRVGPPPRPSGRSAPPVR